MANCLYLHDSYLTKFDFMNYAFAKLVVVWLKCKTLYLDQQIWAFFMSESFGRFIFDSLCVHLVN